MSRSPILCFLIILAGIAILTALGPAEKTLGVNVRVVYLHGAWVWVGLAAFSLAGLVGAAGLATRRRNLHSWSRALGRTGLVFWITYLPISIWAMQTSWNGLYLAEPRWRLAVVFALGGLLLQLGLTLVGDPLWASAGNLVYFITLIVAFRNTENVMHPPSPILNSDAYRIQIYFALLLLMTFLAAWQVARWWYGNESAILI